MGFTLYLLPQASEKQVHFVVSRQTRQQTPDLLQETGWSYSAGSSQPCSAERNNPSKVRALVWFLCNPWDRGMGGLLVFSCLRVLSLVSVTRNSMSYLAMETQKLCCLLVIHWFCPDSAWGGEGKRRQWAVVGQVLMCTQYPGHGHRSDKQCEPAEDNALQQKEKVFS